jgi:hypothetical protein
MRNTLLTVAVGIPLGMVPPSRPGRALICASGSYQRKSFAGRLDEIVDEFRGGRSFSKATPATNNYRTCSPKSVLTGLHAEHASV